MLLKFGREIDKCYGHAVDARQKSDVATDPFTKASFLDLEQHWLFLAHSYEIAERLSDSAKTHRTRMPK